MFTFSGPAMLAGAVCLGLFLTLSVMFAFRDTRRDFSNLFDLRVIRNFFRSLRNCRPRYSLASLLIAATIIPPLVVVAVQFERHDFPAAVIVLGYYLVIVFPLVYWYFVEAFGPGARDRWRKTIDRLRSSDQEPIGPKED